jgi:hypothetical protein
MPQNPMSKGSASPHTSGFLITPGTSEFTDWAREIYVGGAGDLVVVLEDDSELFFQGAVAGSVLPLRAKKVLAESSTSPTETTTATGLIGLY